ncbi:M23 family metallopeptidase [Sphingomonas sp. 1P06PA]|uniref:M23 family metallopeptidase n=1 Tax=Sphingomonas sp. 1P06PA TaxID=554121 RepID=UPI0039A5A260
MHSVLLSTNAGLPSRFRSLFRPRDIFVHDGGTLRRIKFGPRIQMALLVAIVVLIGWSAYAAIQLRAPEAATHDVAVMEAQVAAMAAEREALKRQVADIALADAKSRISETRSLLAKLGLKPDRFHAPRQGGMGGPFEPVTANTGKADPQFQALFLQWKKLDQLEQGVISVPSQRPVQDVSFTSGYGVRSDPFRGSAAMHAGIDLAGPIGTPIYATADGVVGRSGWANGYGNLVEINHGKGIATRYGHLSKLLVSANSRVKRGQLIALMGSTGRSTGSHLHYEVRIDGRAVNPVPYLQSSDYLASLQKRAANQIALGGPEE